MEQTKPRLQFIFGHKRIIFFLLLIITVIILVILFTISKKNLASLLPDKISIAITKNDIKTKSGGLNSLNDEISSFRGEVTTVGTSYFLLEAKNQQIQVNIKPNETMFIIVPFVEPDTDKDFPAKYFKNAQKFIMANIQAGDFLEVMGKLNNQTLVAELVMKYSETKSK